MEGLHMDTDRIVKQILLRAPRARVWRALTDAQEFGYWFGMKFDGVFAPGTRVHGAIVPTQVDAEVAKSQKPYEGISFEIQIEQIIPERLFSYRWHPGAVDPKLDYSSEPTTLVEFTLEDGEGGILLTVTESGFDKIPIARRAGAFRSNDQGWSAQMILIEKYLAHVA
jgi:uncharacterized protein YndB with AHSA1/START domain